MDSLPVLVMTEGVARTYIHEIKYHMEEMITHIETIRPLIAELHEKKGWEALGYKSWRQCVNAEFEQSQAHLYRQLEAAKIEKVVSPTGEIGKIPERVLRPLASLPPEQQQEVWQEATKDLSEGEFPTSSQMEKAVAPLLSKKVTYGKKVHAPLGSFSPAVDKFFGDGSDGDFPEYPEVFVDDGRDYIDPSSVRCPECGHRWKP